MSAVQQGQSLVFTGLHPMGKMGKSGVERGDSRYCR
jgi:hypothetical protein